MNICFFTENFYKGGLDTFIINLFNAWPESKDNLTLVCNSNHPGLETIKEKTYRSIKIKKYNYLFTSKIAYGQRSIKINQSFPFNVFLNIIFQVVQYFVLLPWYLINLAFFFRNSEFDRLMVVNGGYPASLICRCAAIAWRLSGKKPYATFNFHNSSTKAPWYFSFPEFLIDQAIIRSSKQIVSVSYDCLSTLNCRKAFLGCKKLSFIYNGIEDPILPIKVMNDELEKKYSTNQYCLMLATYESRKGHAYLLQALKTVVKDFPNVRLEIYGYGKQFEKQLVADEVRRLSLENNVSLNDFTTNTAKLISNASVVVVPSQSYESFGLTIIEAMAFGTPVITTNVGGMPEVLFDSKAGYVCSKDNPDEFAVAIKTILWGFFFGFRNGTEREKDI